MKKNNQAKSFTFKVAQKADKQEPAKARDGVAVAGCSMAQTPWGVEPVGEGWQGRDTGHWC